MVDFRTAILAHLLSYGPAFFESMDVGSMNALIWDDVRKLEPVIVRASMRILRTSTLGIGALVLFLLESVKLTLIILALLLCISLPTRILVRKTKKLSEVARVTAARAERALTECLMAVSTVQSFSLEHHEAKRFRDAQNKTRRQLILMERQGILAGFVSMLCIGSSMAIVLLSAVYMMNANMMSAGELGPCIVCAFCQLTNVIFGEY